MVTDDGDGMTALVELIGVMADDIGSLLPVVFAGTCTSLSSKSFTSRLL